MASAATTPPAQPVRVPDELVQAALRAAAVLGRQVADVPVAAIAAQAGMRAAPCCGGWAGLAPRSTTRSGPRASTLAGNRSGSAPSMPPRT